MVMYSKKPNNPTKSCKARRGSLQFKHPQPVDNAVLLHQEIMELSALSAQFEAGFADLSRLLQRLDATVGKLDATVGRLVAILDKRMKKKGTSM